MFDDADVSERQKTDRKATDPSYNESIQLERFSSYRAAELQNLAVTYNKVYQENEETQKTDAP